MYKGRKLVGEKKVLGIKIKQYEPMYENIYEKIYQKHFENQYDGYVHVFTEAEKEYWNGEYIGYITH